MVRAASRVPSIAASRWVTSDGIDGQLIKEQEIRQPLGNDGIGNFDHNIGHEYLVVSLELTPYLIPSRLWKHGVEADRGTGALIRRRRCGECYRMTVQVA